MANRETDPWIEITWAELRQWAGRTTVARGRRYQENGHVVSLARLPSNRLQANVRGNAWYEVWVSRTNGQLQSACSCPVGTMCKHAVATVLEYLHCVENGLTVPEVTDTEAPRPNGGNGLSLPDSPTDWSWDRPSQLSEDELSGYLNSLKSGGLRRLILTLARRYPEVDGDLRDRARLAAGGAEWLVAEIQRDIQFLSSEPAWVDEWTGDRSVPDYSSVRRRLALLLHRGYADALLPLGRDLLERGNSQVESSQDDGETAEAITRCLNVVFKGLAKSSLPAEEKLLWVLDTIQDDYCDLCGGADQILDLDHPPEVWNRVADRLLARWEREQNEEEAEGKVAGGETPEAYVRQRRRRSLFNQVIVALERAQREEEIIPLYEREAEVSLDYLGLVERLIEAGRLEDATTWIRRGWEASRTSSPVIVFHLRSLLETVWKKEKNHLGLASLAAEDFWIRKDVNSYLAFRKAARTAGVWDSCQAPIREFLLTGRQPKSSDWPLAPTGFAPKPASLPRDFPMRETLIRIALVEQDPVEILAQYEEYRKNARIPFGISPDLEDAVAKALQDHEPELAIAIWKRLAEQAVAKTNPAAYAVAVGYLLPLKELLSTTGREPEWLAYIQSLRTTHARKRRFLEELDSLEQVRIFRRR